MSSKGDPSIGPTVVTGILGTILTIVLVTVLHSYYGHELKSELARKVIAQPSIAVDQVRAEQLRQITEYRWVDPNAKTVAIPIERAMELVVAERAGQSPPPHALPAEPAPSAAQPEAAKLPARPASAR